MTKKSDVTFVSFLLDETGSMQSIKDDTLGGFNSYIETLKKEMKGECSFTLIKFDSNGMRSVCTAASLDDIPELNDENYRPGASTPLIDSAMEIIKRTEKMVKDFGGKPNVQIIIQTDGYENSSRKYTNADLADKIKKKTKKGWAFNYIGAGIDAYSQAGKWGISQGSTMSYDSKKSGETFQSLARGTVGYAATADFLSTEFTDEEKKKSGDKFKDKSDNKTAS